MWLAEQGGGGNSGTTPLIFVDQKENRKRKRQSIADLINYQLVCVEIGFTQKWHRDAKFNCEISV